MRFSKHNIMRANSENVRRLARWLGLVGEAKMSDGHVRRMVWHKLKRQQDRR